MELRERKKFRREEYLNEDNDSSNTDSNSFYLALDQLDGTVDNTEEITTERIMIIRFNRKHNTNRRLRLLYLF